MKPLENMFIINTFFERIWLISTKTLTRQPIEVMWNDEMYSVEKYPMSKSTKRIIATEGRSGLIPSVLRKMCCQLLSI